MTDFTTLTREMTFTAFLATGAYDDVQRAANHEHGMELRNTLHHRVGQLQSLMWIYVGFQTEQGDPTYGDTHHDAWRIARGDTTFTAWLETAKPAVATIGA